MTDSTGRTLAAAGVVALLLLAGCAAHAPFRPSAAAASTPTADGPEGGAGVGAANASRERTPWSDGTVTVAVENEANASRDFRPQVRAAVRFWNGLADRPGRDASLRLVDGDADVVVRFETAVDRCGFERREEVVGCAPLVERGASLPDPVVVRVEAGYTDGSTVRIVEHELGHVLGVGHRSDPPVMSTARSVTRLQTADAADRKNPWRGTDLSVYLAYDNVSRGDAAAYRRAARNVLEYYESGANGWTRTDYRFTRATARGAADVVVVFGHPERCRDAGVCWRHVGDDVDGDGEMEYYTTHRVYVDRVGQARAAYQLAVGLGMGLGVDDRRALPPPLDGVDDDPARAPWIDDDPAGGPSRE